MGLPLGVSLCPAARLSRGMGDLRELQELSGSLRGLLICLWELPTSQHTPHHLWKHCWQGYSGARKWCHTVKEEGPLMVILSWAGLAPSPQRRKGRF